MNDKENKQKATAVQADRLDFLKHEIERVGREADNYLALMQEQHELMFGYDWYDEVFEENGKKGLRNVRGEVVVPAIYDSFCMPRPYYLPMLLVGQRKATRSHWWSVTARVHRVQILNSIMWNPSRSPHSISPSSPKT